MTFSIVALDPATGHLGVAVASRFLAAGALVPHLEAGKGALATQAFVNPLYGVDGLAHLRGGLPAPLALELCLRDDTGRAHRQLHMVDAQGRTAAFTGDACVPWAGHMAQENVSVAGNMLVGREVLEAMLAVYTDAFRLPLPERLLAALAAGDAAGGDKRGRQSAGLAVVRGEPYRWIDLRVDDHAAPIPELARLLQVAGERYLHMADFLPTRDAPSGNSDRSALEARIAAHAAERSARGASSASHASDA